MADYKKLVEISIYHSFFKNNECKNLSVIPSGDTKTVFHKTDLIFNTTGNKNTVYYNADFIESLLAYKNDDIKLFFKLIKTDHSFSACTELEPMQGKILYFDSSSTRNIEDQLYLNSSEFVTANDSKDVNDELFNNVLTRVERVKLPVGIICINLSDLILNDNLTDNKNHYAIQFKARQTYWRYNIIQTNNNPFHNLIIKDNRQNIEFSENESVKLSNGDQANRIISTQPIPHCQYQDQQFDLVGIKDNQETILMKQLETPDIKNVSKENNKRISELYIYC
ncbi:MAG: hypothetical protein P4L28_07280 [Paludibacteraceae bacterium]|nr:hypothetical protein [Paludibacteraceae bacterium]